MIEIIIMEMMRMWGHTCFLFDYFSRFGRMWICIYPQQLLSCLRVSRHKDAHGHMNSVRQFF